jgi:two-component system, LytTR family, response regulator
MRMNCIIIEDEPLAQERVRDYLQKIPFVHLLTTFDNCGDAMLFLKSNKIDLIFLDINLGDFSGIQLLEAVRIDSQVIITTAYHEYALKGFELNVTDYLLKPYTFERFLQAVDRAQNNLSGQGGGAGRSGVGVAGRSGAVGGWGAMGEKKFIFVKTEYRLEKVVLNEVLYIEGVRDYRRIFVGARQVMTLQTFGEFETEVPAAIICRVHKSFMVAIDKIDSIERDEIKIGGRIIPISETYRGRFFEIIRG